MSAIEQSELADTIYRFFNGAKNGDRYYATALIGMAYGVIYYDFEVAEEINFLLNVLGYY